MATPVLRAMRKHFGPSARLVGILRPNLSECWPAPPGSTSRGISTRVRPNRASDAGLGAADAAAAASTWRSSDQLTGTRPCWPGWAGPRADRLRPRRPRRCDRGGLPATAQGRRLDPGRWSIIISPWPRRPAARRNRRGWNWRSRPPSAAGQSHLAQVGTAGRRPRHRHQRQRRLRSGKTLADRALRAWPGRSSGSSTTTY